jgi:hypothetical protein
VVVFMPETYLERHCSFFVGVRLGRGDGPPNQSLVGKVVVVFSCWQVVCRCDSRFAFEATFQVRFSSVLRGVRDSSQIWAQS